MKEANTLQLGARRRTGNGGPLREAWLLGLGIATGIVGGVLPHPVISTLLLTIAGSLLVLVVGMVLVRQARRLRGLWLRCRLGHVLGTDGARCLAADEDGAILYRNAVVASSAATVSAALLDRFAHPDPLLARLQSRARQRGAAHEDVVTGQGRTRVSVHVIGRKTYLWRIEDVADTGADDTGALPQLVLSRSGVVLSVNEALRALIGAERNDLERIVTDLPLRPGEEHELQTLSGLLRCFVAEVEATSGGNRRIIFLPVAAGKVESHDPTAFETLPIAMLRLTAGGCVIAANQAARALMGEVEIGRGLGDLFEGLGRPVADWVADARAGRAERRPEVMRLRGHPSELFLQVMLSRVVVEGRSGFIAVLTDATQLKTLEAQFVQAQKMQAIGQLAGGVAHDFNNLLTAISGHCDLLMLRHHRADPDYADLDQISQNVNRAAALVRQLLAFSRKQTMNPEVLDLRDTLSELTHLLNRLVGERVALTLLHDPELRPIRADKRQLEQVIMNLVVNARDAMPAGGEIRIETDNLTLRDELGRDHVTIPHGDYVQVRVIDQGSGIAPEVMGKIFEPFFTTKRAGDGTGLGLSTVYGIVKQTGGYIFCDSTPGAGTTFTILLPTYDRIEEAPPPAPASPKAPAAEQSDASATILLVEDEAPVRAFATRALKLRGYVVFEAESGEEALRILEDEALMVDVFVSDVIMPGMDGPCWVAKAMEKRPGTAVVFMSGYAEDAFRDGLPRFPNSSFLPKPFSLSDLVATVQERIAR
ncbi:ATP-binding response regulator [Paenirhodobacter populi]|uniref:ATP-binding response regulator n=1 Tax=Paenirhodobacter populi TaxID=2306993 RepID=UPI001F4DAB43|nr:ATP-binding protein [Sinirhodobacter populi]